MDCGPRGVQVGSKIHAGVESTEELGFVASGDELLKTGCRRPPIGLDTQLAFDFLQEGLSGLTQLFKKRLITEGCQCLFQVEASIRPIARGHGETGAVEQLLSLLPHDR